MASRGVAKYKSKKMLCGMIEHLSVNNHGVFQLSWVIQASAAKMEVVFRIKYCFCSPFLIARKGVKELK